MTTKPLTAKEEIINALGDLHKADQMVNFKALIEAEDKVAEIRQKIKDRDDNLAADTKRYNAL